MLKVLGMKELDKEDIESIFNKMDNFLSEKGKSQTFLVIGGSIIIQLGMPDRSTMDIDFYGNKKELRGVLKKIALEVGIPFDPNDYQFQDEPYFQWVNEDFVHMPKSDEWMDDLEEAWVGQSLTIVRPPVGIIIGSKLAAGREKDIGDVKYLSDIDPSWRTSLEKYLPLFSTEDQAEIRDNQIYLDLYIASRKDETNPSILSPKIPTHKNKR